MTATISKGFRNMSKLLLIMLLALPAPALAAEDNVSDKRERRVCKREPATGSLVNAKRTCLTKKEWKQARDYSKRTVDEWQNSIDGSRKGS